MTEGFVAWGGREYFLWLGLLALGRGLDFFSTWLATPNLELEANPIARRLGWRWGIPINIAMVVFLAIWPFPSLVVATTSFLVASRNFQSAWLMRTMGEMNYQSWMSAQVRRTPRSTFLLCLAAQAGIYTSLGVALAITGWDKLIPVGIGCGMAVYGIAVFLYTSLSVWRMWRRSV